MSQVPSRKIVIAAGGTAGHVVPALAVAQALRAEGASVVFIGGERAEAQLVPAAGFALHTIKVEGLSRTSPAHAGRALARALLAVPSARRLLRTLAPDAVMGAGGYAAAPVLLAALMLRIPFVLTEADSRVGLTNRLFAPFAKRVCLAFPRVPRRWPPRARALGRARAGAHDGRYLVTGRPVAPLLPDRERARASFGIDQDETCVLVFGGSLGARSLNRAAIEAFGGASFRVVHVCGARDHAELLDHVPRQGYELHEYLELDRFAEALAAADLVVARAGGSVAEIAAHGLPAVLVPYPDAAGDHQSANADFMSDAGAAIVIADGELSGPRLAGEVAALLADPARLAAMAAAARGVARRDAAQLVARELLRVARG